ncbi:MAG TPA: RCC1 repeat-containing protein, partial [Planctomycetota bacterium]|nr:RCC1 repeat-containing protein [Planctomycetota bacterium]
MRARVIGILVVGLLLPACSRSGSGTLTPTVSPQIPTSLSAKSGNGRVTLSWASQAAGATFTVRRSLTSGGPYFPISVPSGFTSATTYGDTGLTNDIPYYYVVCASNHFGTSANSAEVTATPGFKAVALGAGSSANHTLVALQDLTLWGFGDNEYAQLGTGRSFSQSALPVQTNGLSEVTVAAAGAECSLALRKDGSVWAWGFNEVGQMGLGFASTTPVIAPGPVPGLPPIVHLSAGYNHSLALAHDGTVWVWGDNSNGQMGNGTSGATPVPTPAAVPGLSGIQAIAAGPYHNLAVAGDGTVWAWGSNASGELGLGFTSPSPVLVPSQVMNLTGVVALSAGQAHSVALRADGTVWCWGIDFTTIAISGGGLPIPSPVQAPNISQAVAIATGSYFCLALLSDGRVLSWGYNGAGECGLGTATVSVPTPTTIPTLATVSAIAAGKDHAVCMLQDGSVACWGSNGSAQSGDGLGITFNTPMLTPNFTQAVAIAGGGTHTIALRSDASLWTWGGNYHGQLGNGTVSVSASTPFQVPGMTSVTALAAGELNSYAVLSDGTIWGWGANDSVQLGAGVPQGTDSLTPTRILGLSGAFTAVTAGAEHVIALRNDGTLWGWGRNSSGSLGTGSSSPDVVPSPVSVAGLSSITAISAHPDGFHTLALRNDGTVWAWGLND